MKQKADQKLEHFDITNEQGHTLGYLYAHQQDRSRFLNKLLTVGPVRCNALAISFCVSPSC
jgi:hypothetical protein